ncbi:MAG TPA: AraC family transcriptional regulator ligand-binding domain-containing protein [Polyangiales bacterium]|nr:AraC family transcriptional regulator ligand-binding domain-containing protein [Polyangiales bacterium]
MAEAATAEWTEATVSITALAPFIRLLEEAGAEPLATATGRTDAALARWGIALPDLAGGADLTLRLPHGLAIELLIDFVEILGDSSAPVRAGMKLQRGDYELLEYLCGSCNTLGESIACLGRYYRLLIAAEHTLFVEGDRAETRFQIAPGLAAPEAIHEFALASNFAMAIMHIDLTDAQLPIEVCFMHKAPPHAAMLESIFGAPVRFECEHNAIVFPIAMLDQPLRGKDPILHALLARQADRELASLADHSMFPMKVRDAIEAELTQGAPLETVAARLHISPGALRSRLRQHGTTYSEMLDRLRRDYAVRALRQTQVGVAELAHSLGFAHPPAFHRAFRRWFGLTPNAFREAKVGHPSARFWQRRERVAQKIGPA